jgi:hypothetical protein
MKKLIGLVALTAIVGAMLIPGTPASAETKAGAAAGTCSVTLAWPGSGSADSCKGTAVGAVVPGGPTCVACPFEATVASYSEDCFAQEPPLLGEASGTLSLDGQAVADYDWLRVGLVAVLTLDPTGDGTVDDGAGVAAFVPLPPLGACNDPNEAMTAQVTGVVFAAQAP